VSAFHRFATKSARALSTPAGLADDKIKSRLADLGGIVMTGSPVEFGKFVVDETEKWAKVIKFAGIKPE